MNSIVRFGRKALVIGAAIAGTMIGVGINTSVVALPEAEVLEKLSPIPMYMLINDQGQPIFATIQDEAGNSSGVTGIFVSLTDAENLVMSRRTEAKKLLEEEQKKSGANPQVVQQLAAQSALWEEANILPIGLDKVYEFAQSPDAEDLTFKFLPTAKQLDAASQVVQQENFPGVPLFFLSMKGTDANGQEIITFPTMATETGEGSGQIPVFFEVDPILQQLEAFGENESLNINVMPLEVFIAKLLDDALPAEEQKFLEAMTLVPSMESSQLIQAAMEQQQQQQ